MHGDLASPLCFQTTQETPHACDRDRTDVLRKGCPRIHKSRLSALLDAPRAVLHTSSHTLSNLARALQAATPVRHRVKRMDRLLGNLALQQECVSIYAAMARHWLLKAVLPLGCRPIVISDADFRSPWFQALEWLERDWVGRIRNRDLVREHDKPSAPQQHCKLLYAKACATACDLGLFDCVRNHP